MEKSVTLRFYNVSRTSPDRPPFADVLRLIAAKGIAEREAYVGADDALVRLEDFAETRGELHGQFIRGQSGNRPGRMLPAGTNTLPFSEPLGHGIAFRYRERDGVFAVQFDSKILSPARMLEYIYQHEPRAEYQLAPRMREDAWERFAALPLRKLDVSVAGHPNVANLERADDSVWANVNRMKAAYGADTVSFQISMGHRDGALAEAAKTLAREVFQRFETGQEDIRRLKGTMDTGEGVPNDELDLMGTLFDVKESFEFRNDNFPEFYTLRRDLIADKIRLL